MIPVMLGDNFMKMQQQQKKKSFILIIYMSLILVKSIW